MRQFSGLVGSSVRGGTQHFVPTGTRESWWGTRTTSSVGYREVVHGPLHAIGRDQPLDNFARPVKGLPVGAFHSDRTARGDNLA